MDVYSSLMEIWDRLNHASPLANLFGIGVPIFTGFSTAYAVFRRRLHHKGAIIARLQDDLDRRTLQFDGSQSELKKLEKQNTELTNRLPEAVLANAYRNQKDGNAKSATRILQEWIEREGGDVSQILLEMAEWAAARAVGDLRAAGLTAAERFAEAAIALYPHDRRAHDLLGDIRMFQTLEGTAAAIPFAEAVEKLNDNEIALRFTPEIVARALDMEAEANRHEDRGRFHIALLQIERAIEDFRIQIGAESLPSLRARKSRVKVWLWLGHGQDAFPEINKIISAETRILGPDHPSTLASRYLLAAVLDSLGRAAAALPIIEDVAAKEATSPECGPDHPSTLSSRYLLALVLDSLGRTAEALLIIEDVVAKEVASPERGPDHPHTLTSRYLLALMLHNLGRTAEALLIIEDVAAKNAASPECGPDHPSTLASRYLLAQVLDSLGRTAEALLIIEDVAAKEVASPERGPDHPHTLSSRCLLARVLDSLGRTAEALPIIEDVAAKYAASHDCGPDHPSTLSSRYLLAQVLASLDRAAEALLIIEDVVAKQSTSPGLGPHHPKTLRSRTVKASVLLSLGRPIEASAESAEVLSLQLANPSIGPHHPDTLATLALRDRM